MLVKNSKEKESKNTNGKSLARRIRISNEEIPELECPACGDLGIRSNEPRRHT